MLSEPKSHQKDQQSRLHPLHQGCSGDQRQKGRDDLPFIGRLLSALPQIQPLLLPFSRKPEKAETPALLRAMRGLPNLILRGLGRHVATEEGISSESRGPWGNPGQAQGQRFGAEPKAAVETLSYVSSSGKIQELHPAPSCTHRHTEMCSGDVCLLEGQTVAGLKSSSGQGEGRQTFD